MRRQGRLGFVALMILVAHGAVSAAPLKVAVFGFEPIDTSLSGEMLGPNPAEQTRLHGLAPALRGLLTKTQAYQVVDTTPVRAKAAAQNMQERGGCDADFANQIGADIAITGTVQMVSELILNINLYLRDAKSGKPVKQLSVDIRGNSHLSWSRGSNILYKTSYW